MVPGSAPAAPRPVARASILARLDHDVKPLFTFHGRINRMTLIVGDLASLAVLAIAALGLEFATRRPGWIGAVAAVSFLPICGAFLAAGCSRAARRLHDLGFGGWLQVVMLAAYVCVFARESWCSSPDRRASSILDLVWCSALYLWPGQRRDNHFGPRPPAGISFET